MKRKANRRGKLTSQEGKLPKHIHHQISTAFDDAKEEVIKEAEIELWDDAEVKAQVVDEVTDFTQTLAEFTIEKITAITSEIRNTVSEIGKGVRSFFRNMLSWITG